MVKLLIEFVTLKHWPKMEYFNLSTDQLWDDYEPEKKVVIAIITQSPKLKDQQILKFEHLYFSFFNFKPSSIKEAII